MSIRQAALIDRRVLVRGCVKCVLAFEAALPDSKEPHSEVDVKDCRIDLFSIRARRNRVAA